MVHVQVGCGRRYTVTFTLPAGIPATRVGLVGDFEDAPWNPEGFALRRNALGQWQVSLELEVGQRYEFRFLVNGCRWVNDDACPMVLNAFGGFHSLLVLETQWLVSNIRQPLVTVNPVPNAPIVNPLPLALPNVVTAKRTLVS
jgi:hypothetical protein